LRPLQKPERRALLGMKNCFFSQLAEQCPALQQLPCEFCGGFKF
jgi:hypothetical protein